LTNLGDWIKHVEAASKAMSEDDWQAAINAADQAIALMPNYSDPDSPFLLKARAYKELEDDANQFVTLEQFWQAGGYQTNALKELADFYLADKQIDSAIEVYNAINLIDPFDLDVHLVLGDLLLEQQNANQALTEYRVAMALDPLDKADVFYRIGSAYNALGNTDQAKAQALAALEIAPHFRPAQKLLMETVNPSITQ